MQKPFFKSRLFKLPNHKRFDFSPRYYDQDKERLENRRAQIAKELNKDSNETSTQREIRIREQFKSRGSHYNTSSSFMSNIRLLVIFGILMIGFYYVYIHLDEVLLALTKSKNIQP
ncbi:MAG: hypothetical protein CMD01_03275 [Flavobacteriales bacterium]|nr:hypothetical protein [Flavobacteriales bacterium]|tara:strand:+ start:224 stop:571 length:348 start_codon:yes stop_codon:yes gene_type:complete